MSASSRTFKSQTRADTTPVLRGIAAEELIRPLVDYLLQIVCIHEIRDSPRIPHVRPSVYGFGFGPYTAQRKTSPIESDWDVISMVNWV